MSNLSTPLVKLAGLILACMSLQANGATLFADDFNDGNADGWSVVKDGQGAPAWQVTSGSYRQSNGVSGATQSFQRGTYAFYEDGLGLTDYQMSAHLTPLGTGSVGVMFRYRDNNNYYRFSINRNQGFSRLEKKVKGVFKTLAFNGIGPDYSQPHTVTLHVVGTDILVYLDGKPLFGAVDTSLSSGTVALFTQAEVAFDSVTIDTSGSTPKVIVASPISSFIETGGTLDVAAVAKNVPAGGGVRFTLDAGASTTDSSAPYSARFTNIALGDHSVRAVIVDGAGLALPNPLAQDTNTVIGVRGRYFVAMGDSITNGFGDDISADDASDDGRNVSRGYAPILNNLLSAQLGRPITVMNEGMGGTTSGIGTSSGASRVASTKARHTKSQYWLIMFGTNDSKRPVASGKGLLPGDPGYNNSFKENMQRIITTLKQSNKTPILAKVPFFVNAPASQDALIRDYNVVVDELVQANDIPVTPPDFYTYFKQHPGQLPDNVHPNGDGYQAMAQLWFEALAGSGILN